MNGDVLTTLDYRDLVGTTASRTTSDDRHRTSASIKIDYGVLHLGSRNGSTREIAASFEEKPEIVAHVSMGIYVHRAAVLEFIPRPRHFDFPDLVDALLRAGERVGAYPARRPVVRHRPPRGLRGCGDRAVGVRREHTSNGWPARAAAAELRSSFVQEIRRISIIVPMREEAEHVEPLVADIAAQDFEGEVEMLVADGGSTDGSAGRIPGGRRGSLGSTSRCSRTRAAPVSHGLNACLRHVTGDLIVRLDCHSRYPSDYLRLCAVAAEETGAWNVGGVVQVPEGRTRLERGVAAPWTVPFGGIGWTRYAILGRADRGRHRHLTAPFGRRLFALPACSTSPSFATRTTSSTCGSAWPAAGSCSTRPFVRYAPRGSFRALFSQYYEYGLWKIRSCESTAGLSARSLAPSPFVCSLAGLGGVAIVSSTARMALGAELALYTTLALVFGVATIRRRQESPALLPRVLLAFATFHTAYGIGMARALLLGFRWPAPPEPAAARGGSRSA